MEVRSRTVSMIYTGSLDTLSLATTSRKEGPVNLRWRRELDWWALLPAAGVSAPPDTLGAGLLCTLDGREVDGPDSVPVVSSLRSDGNRDDVDILEGFGAAGWSSGGGAGAAAAAEDLLPRKKGVMKDPLAMTARDRRKVVSGRGQAGVRARPGERG